MCIDGSTGATSPRGEEALAPERTLRSCGSSLAGPGYVDPMDIISENVGPPRLTPVRAGGPGGTKFAPGGAMTIASVNSRTRPRSPKSSSMMSLSSAARAACPPAGEGPTSGGGDSAAPRDRERDLSPIPRPRRAQLHARQPEPEAARQWIIREPAHSRLYMFCDIVPRFLRVIFYAFYIGGIPKKSEMTPR